MELICPSCEARYRVPADAIGESGRQVSCSNCGHGWHAARPLVLGHAAGGAGAPGSALGPTSDEEEPGRAATAEVHRLHSAEPARTAQLAEIRQMIAQVQSDDGRHAEDEQTRLATAADPGRETGHQAGAGAGAAATSAAAGAMVRPGPEPRPEFRRADETEDSGASAHQDPLRRRMAEHDARAAREREERERLRRSMHRHEADRRTGSGAFLTGFLLVVLLAAALLAAYVLAPEIIARLPDAEPILSEYVAFVDELRRGIADAWEAVRAWVLDLAER